VRSVEAKSVREGGDEAEARARRDAPLPVLSPVELARLDRDEPAARTRRAFVGISFAAGVVCLLPQQWASGALCLVLSLGLYLWHRRCSARERPAGGAPAASGGLVSST
jgi:hypothetical protein